MSKQIKLENSKLFIELSEQEQEGVSGGFSFFLQQTDISTFANNKSTLSENFNSVSSGQETGYKLSQFTFAFNFLDNFLS